MTWYCIQRPCPTTYKMIWTLSQLDMVQSLDIFNRSDSCFDDYFAEAQSKCYELQNFRTKVSTSETQQISSRIDGISHTQQHHQISKDQYRVELYFNTLDIMISALGNRSDEVTCSALKLFLAHHPQKLSSDNTSNIPQLGEFYKHDLDSVSLVAEFELFRRHSEFRGCKSIVEVLKVLNLRQLTCISQCCLFVQTVPNITSDHSNNWVVLFKIKL